jgi:hypothetical protein
MHSNLRRPATALRRHLATRSRGQSLVEFALILPVFALLFAATLDLGRLFYAQITLTNSAREGAFEGARNPSQFQKNQPCDPTTNKVVCRVILESNASFISVAPKDIDMWCSPDCAQALDHSVTVEVQGQFTFVTPLMAPFFGGKQIIDLKARAIAQREVIPTPGPTDGMLPPPTIIPPPPTEEPTASPTPGGGGPTPTPAPVPECTVILRGYQGQLGLYPPNVIGMGPDSASAAISAKGLTPVAEGDLRTGAKHRVREQSPDSSVCVPIQDPGWEVHFKYRP